MFIFQVLASMQEKRNPHVSNGCVNWYIALENNLVRSSKGADTGRLVNTVRRISIDFYCIA